jgi:predicted RNase H-like HicB family nuclease
MAIKYTVILERVEDGVYIATVPVISGCISDGGTREEALKNVREAIELYIGNSESSQ